MTRRRLFTDSERATIDAMLTDGESAAAVGRAIRRHGSVVARYAVAHGLVARRTRRNWTTADDRAVINLYERHVGVGDIMAHFNIYPSQLYIILRRNEVPMRYPRIGEARRKPPTP